MNKYSPIGVFDSGVGGSSIWKEIHQLLPNENTIYLADSKNAPYGNKTQQHITELSLKNTQELINRGCKRILPIKYTPDFIGDNFIIECKGRPNESFPLRWKLFKKLVSQQFPNYTLFKPQNQKECDIVIRLIKEAKKK